MNCMENLRVPAGCAVPAVTWRSTVNLRACVVPRESSVAVSRTPRSESVVALRYVHANVLESVVSEGDPERR